MKRATSPPLVVPKSSKRELVLGFTIGAIVIALLIYGLLSLSGSAIGQNLTGKITARHFEKRPAETQITIGAGGVATGESDGDYTFTVHVAAQNKDYTVWVDPSVYKTKKVGDEFTFPRPPHTSEK